MSYSQVVKSKHTNKQINKQRERHQTVWLGASVYLLTTFQDGRDSHSVFIMLPTYLHGITGEAYQQTYTLLLIWASCLNIHRV